MENKNNKLVVFLLIIIICLLAGGGFLVYKTIFNNSNSNTSLGESKNNNNQFAGESNNNVNSNENSLVTYVNNIPQVNIEAASDFNKEVKEYYDRATKGTDPHIVFSSIIKDNVLFCSIDYSYRVGAGGDFEKYGFVYDLSNNKTMKIKEVLSKFDISINKLDIPTYEKEIITGSNPDKSYIIMPNADGLFTLYSRGMGINNVELYYS